MRAGAAAAVVRARGKGRFVVRWPDLGRQREREGGKEGGERSPTLQLEPLSASARRRRRRRRYYSSKE